MKPQGSDVGSQTDKPEYMRTSSSDKQDLAIISTAANQTHCAEARRLQSISTACNEKHIFRYK